MSEADLTTNPTERPDITKVLPALPFVIQALLTRGGKQRIYIADFPERVAALVLALTEILPARLLESLTFSTYERDFVQSQPLLVGTYWVGIEQGAGQDLLPPACYASDKGPALAINCYSQRQSPLQAGHSIQAFAQYATEYFSRPNELMTIRAIAERYAGSFPNAEAFLGLADFYTGVVDLAQLGAEHLTWLLRIPELANSFLKREETQQSLLAQLELPSLWWTNTGKTLIKSLAERPNTEDVRVGLIGLAKKVVGRVVAALQDNRHQEAERWAELIWDMAPPHITHEPWLALLNTGIATGTTPASWNLRWFVLQAWNTIARRQPGAVNVALFRPWLELSSWDEFISLLKLDLPSDWYKISLEKLLGAPIGGPMQAMQTEDKLENIIKEYMKTAQNQLLAITLFARIDEWGYAVKLSTIAAILKQIHQQPQAAGLFLRVGITRRTLPEIVNLLTGIPAATLPQVLAELVLADPDWGGADAAHLREWRTQIGQGSANGSAWLLSAPGWWKQAGRVSMSQLGEQVRRGQASMLIPAFTSLGNQAKQRLIQAVQQPNEPMLLFLVDVLATVSASGVISDPWTETWGQVSTLPKPLSWSARFALLAKWQAHAPHDDNALRPWLLLSWAEVDQRLWTLPVHWQRLALISLLGSSLNQPLAQATAALDRYGDQLEPLLASLFRTGQTQPLIVSFFAQVAAQGRYTRKLSLLSALLEAASGSPPLLEKLLQEARVTPEETTALIEQYSAPLLQDQALPDLYLQYIKDYFESLATSDEARLAAANYQPIRRLGTYAYTNPGNAALAALFTSLTERALRAAAPMLRQGVHESAAFWVNILALTCEASKQTGEWLKLLRAVKQPGPGILPDLRLQLAYYWTTFEKELALDDIRPWLQFDWETAYALMQRFPSAPFPEAWRLEVFLGLTARQQSALSPEEAGIVRANFQWVATAMQAAVQDASKREQAAAFLGKLTQAKIHQRVHLLPDLLLSAADNTALAERLWQAAKPSRRQGEWFRTYQLPRLQAPPGAAQGWRVWLEQTLDALAPAGGRALAPLQPSGGQGAAPTSGKFFTAIARVWGRPPTEPPPQGTSAAGGLATGRQRARKAANQSPGSPFPPTPRQPAASPPAQPYADGPLVEQRSGRQAKSEGTAKQRASGQSKIRKSSSKRRQEQEDTFALWLDRILIAVVIMGAIALIAVILLLLGWIHISLPSWL